MIRSFLCDITLANGIVVRGRFSQISADDLPVSGVTPGGYNNASIVVDRHGLVIAAAEGVPPASSGAVGGDLSGTLPNPAVSKVDGVSYPASPAVGTRPIITAADTATYLPDGIFAVTNKSGGAVAANDVGYIDVDGKFATTTTANLDGVAWCVVVLGGADASTVFAARTGVVTVALDANCAAGDFLSTSTTAKQAGVNTTMRPECFAVARTANVGGAGGTCSALMLPKTRFVPTGDAAFAFNIDAHGDSLFVSTINGVPSSTSVVYDAPSSGTETWIKPKDGASNWAKFRLWNLTRGNYRLINSVNTATNTITTVASVDDWDDTDDITIESQTVDTGSPVKMSEIDLSQATALSIVPATARAVVFEITNRDTATDNNAVFLHPFETFETSKQTGCRNQVAATVTFLGHVTIKLVNRVFCIYSEAGGATSKITGLAITGYYNAEP